MTTWEVKSSLLKNFQILFKKGSKPNFVTFSKTYALFSNFPNFVLTENHDLLKETTNITRHYTLYSSPLACVFSVSSIFFFFNFNLLQLFCTIYARISPSKLFSRTLPSCGWSCFFLSQIQNYAVICTIFLITTECFVKIYWTFSYCPGLPSTLFEVKGFSKGVLVQV